MKTNGPKFRLLYAAPAVKRSDNDGEDGDYPNNYKNGRDGEDPNVMEDVYAGPDFFGAGEPDEPDGPAGDDYPYNNAESEDLPIAPVYAGPEPEPEDDEPEEEPPKQRRKLFMGRVYAGPQPRRRKAMECVYAGPEMMAELHGGGSDEAEPPKPDADEPPAKPTDEGGTESRAEKNESPKAGRRYSDTMPRMEAVYSCPSPAGKKKLDEAAMSGVYAGPDMMGPGPREATMMFVYAGPQAYGPQISPSNGFAPAPKTAEIPEGKRKFCPNCGKPSPETANFCSECGFALTKKQPEPAEPPADTGEKRICRVCGHTVPAGKSFCQECGSPVAPDPGPEFTAVYAAPRSPEGRRFAERKTKKLNPFANSRREKK